MASNWESEEREIAARKNRERKVREMKREKIIVSYSSAEREREKERERMREERENTFRGSGQPIFQEKLHKK